MIFHDGYFFLQVFQEFLSGSGDHARFKFIRRSVMEQRFSCSGTMNLRTAGRSMPRLEQVSFLAVFHCHMDGSELPGGFRQLAVLAMFAVGQFLPDAAAQKQKILHHKLNKFLIEPPPEPAALFYMFFHLVYI